MIKVANLSKRYGQTLAIDNLSFEVERGEIFGFLGPNGAGKSSLMRILSCYMPPSEGEVEIDGLNIFRDSMEIRERIGYMPEDVPLYGDMRVAEFLRFRALLKGLRGRRHWDRVFEVIEQCGLRGQEKKLIQHLSKGNRQKVALADALINKPDVLILDEPTIGLDPNQIRNIRKQIKSFAPDQTVLLSTHILSEVEAICDRVLIINKGRSVTCDTPKTIINRLSGTLIYQTEIKGPRHEVVKHFNVNPDILRVSSKSRGDWTLYELECDKAKDIRSEIYHLVRTQDWELRELTCIPQNLEDAFTALTEGRDKIL
jgi:ABC-2 type transport system ATP-binding protein